MVMNGGWFIIAIPTLGGFNHHVGGGARNRPLYHLLGFLCLKLGPPSFSSFPGVEGMELALQDRPSGYPLVNVDNITMEKQHATNG